MCSYRLGSLIKATEQGLSDGSIQLVWGTNKGCSIWKKHLFEADELS